MKYLEIYSAHSGFTAGHFPRLFIRFPPVFPVQILGGPNFKSDRRYYNRAGYHAAEEEKYFNDMPEAIAGRFINQ